MKIWISRNVAGGLKLSINKPTITEQRWWNAEDDTFFHINSKYFPEVTFTEFSADDVELEMLTAAAGAYRRWDPDQGFYAVGYHSVQHEFVTLLRDPRILIHRP